MATSTQARPPVLAEPVQLGRVRLHATRPRVRELEGSDNYPARPRALVADPMRLAIADPPYPPMFSERRDLAGGGTRLTWRSRATRWYGVDGTADQHPHAAEWDELPRHRQLLEQLVEEFDGFAIATTPDGLGAYAPLPVSAQVLAWVRPNVAPGARRLISTWEPVIVLVPEARRPRGTGPRVKDALVAASDRSGFAGAKPAEWTRWILDVLGYDPDVDELVDLFPGSGAVTNEAAQGVIL